MPNPAMTSPAEIARGLSEAQRDALFGIYSWSSPWEQEEGERELYRLGLWGPHGGDTLLAAAVRSELQKGMSDG